MDKSVTVTIQREPLYHITQIVVRDLVLKTTVTIPLTPTLADSLLVRLSAYLRDEARKRP